jgi:chromosome partitioning protein
LGRVIGIANQKGGVGKTTTTVNLASCIAVADRRVLIIDMDPQANATSGLGIDKNNVRNGSYSLIMDNDAYAGDFIEPTDYENLYIIPANIDLTGADIELVNEIGREYKLKNAISSIINDYEYIFIDTPPSLGLLTINTLTAIDSVIIPIQCEYYALEGISQLMNTILRVKKNLNKNLDIEGIVLTMYDVRTNLSQQVEDEVRSYFKAKVYKTVVPRNVRLSEAPSFGKPIIAYDIISTGAEAYLKLAREVMNSG